MFLKHRCNGPLPCLRSEVSSQCLHLVSPAFIVFYNRLVLWPCASDLSEWLKYLSVYTSPPKLLSMTFPDIFWNAHYVLLYYFCNDRLKHFLLLKLNIFLAVCTGKPFWIQHQKYKMLRVIYHAISSAHHTSVENEQLLRQKAIS